MQLIADESFRCALVELPDVYRTYLANAMQEMIAAPMIADFEQTGLELIDVSEVGFTLPIKANHQLTLASLVATLTEDGKLKVSLVRYF